MTGDTRDMLGRLKSLLPGGWFAAPTPLLDGVLTGIATALSFAHGFVCYARKQARISTATDGFLDLISADYFGPNLPRRSGELDDPYRRRILAQLFLEKGTRKGLITALTVLTGRVPLVFEPARPLDTGGYGVACGYGVAGGYGSLLLNNQLFVTAYRPTGQGIPLVAGYGTSPGGYSTPSRADYGSLSQVIGPVTDADILSTIDAVMPAGAIAWTRITS